MTKKKNWGDILYLFVIIAFFYLPILYVVFFSFNSTKSLTVFSGFSLRWYEKMFRDRTMMESIYYTVIVAIIATSVSTVVGTITAIGLSKNRKIVRELALQVNNLPMLNPDIVTAIGLMLFFVSLKVQTGLFTMILAHITFCIPYVVITVMPKLRSLDDNVAEAALDLGATPWQALTKVIIPQIKDAIVAGALIAFTMSFDDFVISFFTTGPGVNNISIYVYTMYKRINPSINALSSIIILGITTILIILNVVPMLRKKDDSLELKAKKPSSWKKWTAAGVTAAIVLAVVLGVSRGNAEERKYEGQTLNVYNAGEYIEEELISQFEEEYGVKINYSMFSSNEELYTKLMSGTLYDVLVPSDYMIQRLMIENYLQPIDKSIVTDLDLLAEGTKNLEWDPDNTYAVPYFWGNVGICYDPNIVDPEDVENEGFAVFKNPKYAGQIFMYDSERDAFMIAFKDLGYSMNTSDPEEIQAAYEWLIEMDDAVNPAYVTDEIIDGLINGEKAMGLVYSGDAAYILSENEEMAYFCPEYGTNLWVDAMVIPATAQNPELANVFINFMLQYDAAYANSDFVGYASNNQEVLEVLSGEGGTYEGNDAYVPRNDNPNDEVFINNDFQRKMISDLWVKVKLH
ncbi:MAG: extracellular solute-binding protein [Erysipelotrichales bacterium]|nr:extracellular solute-binding protein [Erysipelotrichales bacterium]MBQ5543247.1 extracellular solute-binding protein [Erysipelotrichales bacterium]